MSKSLFVLMHSSRIDGRKISVAIASYNGASHIGAQVDSIFKQTRPPDELVIRDDGSSDRTLKILEELRRTYGNALIVKENKRRLGFTANFEQVISDCSGDFIFLSDQDDIWMPEKIETVMREFDKSETTMVVVNNQWVTNADCQTKLGDSLSLIRSQGLNEEWYVAGCATAFRKRFKKLILPIPENIHGHDTWISFLSSKLEVRKVIEAPLQFYRRHDNNVSDSLANRKVFFPKVRFHWQFRLKAADDAWLRTVELNNIFINRLENLQGCDFVLPESRTIALTKLRDKNWALLKRIEINSSSRGTRVFRIFEGWKAGVYSHFEGWLSVAKDIVR